MAQRNRPATPRKAERLLKGVERQTRLFQLRAVHPQIVVAADCIKADIDLPHMKNEHAPKKFHRICILTIAIGKMYA